MIRKVKNVVHDEVLVVVVCFTTCQIVYKRIVTGGNVQSTSVKTKHAFSCFAEQELPSLLMTPLLERYHPVKI